MSMKKELKKIELRKFIYKGETPAQKKKVRKEIEESMKLYQIKITKLEPHGEIEKTNPAKPLDRSLFGGRIPTHIGVTSDKH